MNSSNTANDDATAPDEPSIEDMKQQTLAVFRQHRAAQRAAGAGSEGDGANGAGVFPASGPEAEGRWTPPVGSVSEAALLPPNPPSGFNRDGTYSLRGDRKTIRDQLDKAGITMFLPIQGGLMIGTSQAQRAHDMVMANARPTISNSTMDTAEDVNASAAEPAATDRSTSGFAPDFRPNGTRPIYDFGDPLAPNGQPGDKLAARGSNEVAVTPSVSPAQITKTKDPELAADPVLSKEAQRRASIIGGTPGKIRMVDNPDAMPHVMPWFGRADIEQVSQYSKIIDQKAREAGVDPDLAKAIIYMETTHGWYDDAAKWAKRNQSIRPMNVGASTWAGLGYTRQDLENPEKNIEAGIKIIKGISDRLEEPTVRNIATLYNSLAKDKVSDYGITVEDIYKTKPWARPLGDGWYKPKGW